MLKKHTKVLLVIAAILTAAWLTGANMDTDEAFIMLIADVAAAVCVYYDCHDK